MEDAGVKAEVYSDVEPEPSFERADELRKFIEKGSFDVVVGIGGGSSMDTAKAALLQPDTETSRTSGRWQNPVKGLSDGHDTHYSRLRQ